jgi:hypothetical protein
MCVAGLRKNTNTFLEIRYSGKDQNQRSPEYMLNGSIILKSQGLQLEGTSDDNEEIKLRSDKICSRLSDERTQSRLVITRRRFELTYSLTEVHSHRYNRTAKGTTENINHYTRGAQILCSVA